MRLPLILLFLQLWVNLAISLPLNACSKLPSVSNAYVTEGTKKADYQEGDVIIFTCEIGYISGLASKYVCTDRGWFGVRKARCNLKPCELPEDIPNGSYAVERGEEIAFGTVIRYSCNPGYDIVGTDNTITCLLNGWSNTAPTCEPVLGCETPPLLSNGDTKNRARTQYSHNERVEYICQDDHMMEGEPYQTCINGKWTGEMRCLRIPCAVGTMNPNLRVTGLPPETENIKTGHQLHFHCSDEYTLDGPEVIECLETGYWNASFPSCYDGCKATVIPDSVRITTNVPDSNLMKGQKLTFTCRIHNHFMRGNATVECLANGQWSNPFPTCGAAVGCGKPPFLPDGDITTSSKSEYKHNDRIEYTCQNYYIMQGERYKTCVNGEWIGHMRCLKPCTVNREDMNRHNIRFRYSRDDKLYSEHNDVIEFQCTRGRRVGTVEMRQKCIEGVMHLPTCQ